MAKFAIIAKKKKKKAYKKISIHTENSPWRNKMTVAFIALG